MRPPGDVRFDLDAEPGLVIIRLPKHTLVLSVPVYVAAIRRGKWWKRRQAELRREAGGAHANVCERSPEN